MDNINKKKETEDKNRTALFTKVSVAVLVLVFMLISFAAGMYLPGQSQIMSELAKKEAIYMGELLGKYEVPEDGKIQQNIDFDLYWDIWDILKSQHVKGEEISDKELFYGSLQGMVDAVKDPYTSFMDPSETRSFQDTMSGTFEGIGAEVGIRDGVLTIIAPLEGSPAERSGLKPGDKVLSVNGSSTEKMSLDEAVYRIRGEKGTEVVLSVGREGVEEIKDITITRGVIELESVKTEIRDDGIFVIEISHFNSDTISSFRRAVSEIKEKDPEGIILDLRNNAGGYLDTSIEVASAWIEDGPVVIEELGSQQRKEYSARGRAELKDIPTVVLVNKGSASASEIVAGALQDYEKGVVVGEQTFGKGSVQSLVPMKDGSSVKVTVARWLTPKGNSISEHGVTPNEKVEFTLEDYEEGRTPQRDRAIEILKKMIQGEDLGLEEGGDDIEE